MDGLSSATGVIAVASIAIQLVDSIDKLSTFWNSIKDAPEEISGIAIDLWLLASVLTEIAVEAQHVTPDPSLEAVLQNCQLKVNTLVSILHDIKVGFCFSKCSHPKVDSSECGTQIREIEKVPGNVGEAQKHFGVSTTEATQVVAPAF